MASFFVLRLAARRSRNGLLGVVASLGEGDTVNGGVEFPVAGSAEGVSVGCRRTAQAAERCRRAGQMPAGSGTARCLQPRR